MSDQITIHTNGLEEAIRCAICENPIKSESGCNGSCQYDKELHAKIVEAVMGLAEQRPHGEWVETFFTTGCSICKEEFRMGGEWAKAHFNFCPNCGARMNK